MTRFVVIATVRRGAVKPFEAVSAEMEMRLHESMRLEIFGDAVQWRQGFAVMSEPAAHVNRLMRLARRVG